MSESKRTAIDASPSERTSPMPMPRPVRSLGEDPLRVETSGYSTLPTSPSAKTARVLVSDSVSSHWSMQALRFLVKETTRTGGSPRSTVNRAEHAS